MKKNKFVLAITFIAALIQTAAMADNQIAQTTSQSDVSDTRYGFLNGLDHRSWYSEGNFPEPFLVDDSGLEKNEARFDWSHTEAAGQRNDVVAAEVEKGFGLMTLELKVPFERDSASGAVSQGFGNIEAGARCPFYQYVSANGFFDTTAGAALEVGIPVNSVVSKNAELVPKIFNDLKVGDHFTLQSLFGHSTLFGGGADGGLQTFEYGFVFGWAIQHDELPLRGTQQIIPMFELKGETQLNHGDSGHNSLTGLAGIRANLNTIGRVQPRLGLGFIFPVNNNARNDVHWGIATSLVFEY